MKNTKDLHVLINSLTKAEKRYFKLFIHNTQKTSTNYILLFDAIDKQEVYNEKKLLRKFKQHTFSKQLARTKFLLYEQLLKALRQMYSARTVHAKLSSMTYSVEVLYSKTLYDQSYEVLQKAKKIAFSFELFDSQLHLLELEIRLTPFLKSKNVQSTTHELLTSYQRVTDQVHQENQYRGLLAKVQFYVDTLLNIQDPAIIDQFFQEIFDHPLLKITASPDTFLSKILFLEVHFTYASAAFDYERVNQLGQLIYEMWNQFPEMRMVHKEMFLRTSAKYMYSQIAMEQPIDQIENILKDWQELPIYSKEEEAKRQLEMQAILFIHHLVENNVAQYKPAFEELQVLRKEHFGKIEIHHRIFILYYLIIYFFFTKKYARALQHIFEIDELAGSQLNKEILKYIRLMELIARYEIDNQEIEEKDILRISRHLKKLGPMGKIEKMLVSTIQGMIHLPLKEVPKVMSDLHIVLKDKQATTFNINKMGNQAIQDWITTKLSLSKSHI